MDPHIELALSLSLVGLLTVFAVLVLIALMIDQLRRVDRFLEARHQRKVEAGTVKEPEQNIDDITLVIIAATVATMFKGRAHIKRVHRIHRPHGQWSTHGRAQLQGSHFISRKENV